MAPSGVSRTEPTAKQSWNSRRCAHSRHRGSQGQGLPRATARYHIVHPGVGAPGATARFERVIALGCRKFIVCGGAGVLERCN